MKSLIAAPLMCMVFSFTGCESHHHHHDSRPHLQVTTPERRDVVLSHEYVSQIRSIQHIELRALERGYLDDIFVDEGQHVKKGEPLFQIMPRLYQAELEQAKAEADFAEIEFENTERLAEKNIVAPSELAMTRAKWEKAKSTLALAQARLEFTKFSAPFDGIVGRLHVRKGSLLEEGELLTTLSDNHEMWVYFNVSESEYLAYKGEDTESNPLKVELKMANGEKFPHAGKVTAIEADFNNETGNIAFRATFPNPEELLRHGQTGNILVKTKLKQALLVPQKATYEVLDKRFVLKLVKDNRVKATPVRVGEELEDLFVITSGLKKSDKILIEGLRKVRDGDSIDPEFLPSKAVFSKLQVYAE